MSNGSREELKKHIRRDVIQYAIFRPESAVVIALTLILMAINLIVGLNPNSNLPTEWWMWLIGGGLAECRIMLLADDDYEPAYDLLVEAGLQPTEQEYGA